MTDEQIIKAEVHKSALDLINRQKAELNALYEIINKQNEEISELNRKAASRENLEESFLKTTKEFDKRLEKTVKAERREAIKEFAEKLKKRFYLSAGRCVVEVYHIGNLVKEMTEV